MSPLPLHDFHAARGAVFRELNGCEMVASFGSTDDEYLALTQDAAIIDLSSRGRVCLLGEDREKFLHGQVTNDVLRLKLGQGCYAALTNAKGKIESDLFIYKLAEELLLDFEPGLTQRVIERLNKYIIAENVEVVDVSPHYGLLSVSGPGARLFLESTTLDLRVPETLYGWTSTRSEAGEFYLADNARYGVPGYDLFIPASELEATAQALEKAGGKWIGFDACEMARIESAIPRYGADMTENTLPQEAELQLRAVSFAKGCYIGQEIIARIRTYGQVAKALRLLRFQARSGSPPQAAAKLFVSGKEIGRITSATYAPKYQAIVALAYVRKENNSLGARLQTEDGLEAEIIAIPGGAPQTSPESASTSTRL